MYANTKLWSEVSRYSFKEYEIDTPSEKNTLEL